MGDIQSDFGMTKAAVLKLFVLGVAAPLVVQTAFTLLILRLENSQAGIDVGPIGLLAAAATTMSGFLLLTRGRPARHRVGVAVVYFPLMLLAIFLEALWLDGWLYGNSL